jgi:hypothetical protein
MAVTGICIAIIVWLAIGNVPEGAFAVPSRILVLVLLAIFVVASLATTEVIPWRSQSWLEWRRPKVLGTVIYLLLGAASFVAGIAAVLNPPAAEQATLVAVGGDVAKLGAGVDRLQTSVAGISDAIRPGKTPLIVSGINGVWGEDDCTVTYRLAVHDRSLQMRSVRDRPGMKPYEAEYTINAASDRIGQQGERLSIMDVREEQGWFPGYAVTFTYLTNSNSKTLIWDHRKMNVNAIELTPCVG